jgi:hypothetical protein
VPDMGIKDWFPDGKNNSSGWRLDIVSLLAVIGESSMESHSQALTSSWTCILPRIIPAPQALLKPSRPTRMPQVNAAVVGVHNGTLVQTLNYFPNILHPVEDFPPFAFKVLRITHARNKLSTPPSAVLEREKLPSASNSVDMLGMVESGPPPPPARQSTISTLRDRLSENKKKPRVPPQTLSPLNIISLLSFMWTIGLIIWARYQRDGTAIVALATISCASSIVGYASWWSPVLMKRTFKSKVPAGDVIIRTREGAFLLVKCNEDVARELYTGTEECQYYVGTQQYRILVAIGTFLLMVSVVLLGNCNFAMQAAIGASYIVLNGAFWGSSLIRKGRFWDLSNYDVVDDTPPDAADAHLEQCDTVEGRPSFTRTMWFAIRETKKIGWVKRGGAAPKTDEWDEWLRLAEQEASNGNRAWNAVETRETVVGVAESTPQRSAEDAAEQHVPAYEVPPPDKR